MFAVNGPSGPTSRNERRAPDAREVAARKQAQQRIKAKRMGEFFEVRKLSTKAMGSAESEQQAQNTGW
ncbi:TPA: hypothetical protein N0F65_011640 [Lagenidium giganteum]|uniref:Small EDRK-rich factor-like N-terminal domain-containing protein n=1 Tax=Lagenidium giganteum TaxID=4803 RepID=A0AAV2Z7E7_9STRA|nr:TPA: hypothetical protein N0F65_011640 [Lagenidium giganteum]